MEKIEIVLRREQNNRNGIYLNYINGYWYTYEWSAFLLCMLHPEVEVRKCIGVQPDENYAIARVNKKIIKKGVLHFVARLNFFFTICGRYKQFFFCYSKADISCN